MNIKISSLCILAILVCSCGKPAATSPTALPPTQQATASELPLAAITPVCISPKPTQADIDRALDYTGETFNGIEWARNYSVVDDHVSVTWQNVPEVAMVYLEEKIFPCGYEQATLDHYFDDGNWKLVFQNYESYKSKEECKTNDGLRLYEFEASNQGFNYKINYWVESDTDNRIISTMIAFPFGSEARLAEFSLQLFPKLPNCS